MAKKKNTTRVVRTSASATPNVARPNQNSTGTRGENRGKTGR